MHLKQCEQHMHQHLLLSSKQQKAIAALHVLDLTGWDVRDDYVYGSAVTVDGCSSSGVCLGLEQ